MAETEITASEPGAIIRGQVTAGRPLRQRTLFTRIQGASQNYPIESLRSATTMILAAVIAQTGVSLAAGAIAVGVPPDVAKQGISMGFSTNRDTMDHAKARSMTLCKISGSLISGILCQVVATFENKCVAVAIDPQVQTSGFGWAVADTEQASFGVVLLPGQGRRETWAGIVSAHRQAAQCCGSRHRGRGLPIAKPDRC